MEGEEVEHSTEGTLVVYGIDSKEILPLAIQNELGENLMQKEEIMDEIDIWIFIDETMEYDVVRDEDQMLAVKVSNRGIGIDVLISMVYAKCTQGERLQLWESLSELSMAVNVPWLIGGYFNVIHNENEKLAGRPVTEAEVRDFNHCLNVCNLEDQEFKGSKYT
ncbi:hypothetical protein H5410_026846 [Solanum commersonii]|uniref:Uncharacterized protein n=1 Tax=Solanum commersonii TaxID=4109 RepID=A0A9J5YY80_SOLCO|nr:hypothetical protein H5410_026846 [Solanum commersonii]